MVLKTREKLIEVARQLFAHKGVAKTTMNDIANASEKGRRTIYTYFRNKKEIYAAVLESESETMVAALREVAGGHGSARERLAALIRFRIEHNTVQSMSSLRSWLKLEPRRADRINRIVTEKNKQIIRGLLDEGCAAGDFRPDRCAMLQDFLEDCITRLYITRNDAANPEQGLKAIESFIHFIITDISVSPAK